MSAFRKGANNLNAKKENPFNKKFTKTKFDVLNKNVVGAKGRPGISKAKGTAVRAKSIIPELNRRGRQGEFIDRRFAQRDSNISSEEKMLQRFTRERLRKNKKKSAYNLNEADEDYSSSLTLTHRGRRLDEDGAIFDSDISGSDLDSGNDGELDAVNNFGGSNQDGTKSKSEIMQEVIAKSKLHRYERQKVKEENAALCADLDEEFNSIVGSLMARSEEAKQSAAPAGKEDDYYESIKQMAFDKRAKPSDRTKTDEELKKEAAEMTERIKTEKAKRMSASEAAGLEPRLDDDEEDDHSENFLGDDAQKSIDRNMREARRLIDDFMAGELKDDVNKIYSKLAELCKTRSILYVSRVIKTMLLERLDKIESLYESGTRPTMPDRSLLMLFHLIGLVFSTSDNHHPVATPAQLMMAAHIHLGRFLKVKHLVSGLFLMQTILHYQRESRRYCPELFGCLYPLMRLAMGKPRPKFANEYDSSLPYPSKRLMSRSLHDFLSKPSPSEGLEARPIAFEDLATDQDHTKQDIICFMLNILKTAYATYNPSLLCIPEVFTPFVNLFESQHNFEFITRMKEQIALFKRQPLRLQTFKVQAIPQFNPELDEKPTREQRETDRLKKAYKREYKGAKRELKRDAAFLASHKLQTKLDADRKYKERLQQIMGTISNDGSQAFAPEAKKPKRR